MPFLTDEGFKDLSHIGKFGISLSARIARQQQAFLASPYCFERGKGIIEDITFIAQERNGSEVERVLEKYLKVRRSGEEGTP
ncbi:MAG: hypothetical protein ACREO5_06200 [Candidatus Binatia bacterium]